MKNNLSTIKEKKIRKAYSKYLIEFWNSKEHQRGLRMLRLMGKVNPFGLIRVKWNKELSPSHLGGGERKVR